MSEPSTGGSTVHKRMVGRAPTVFVCNCVYTLYVYLYTVLSELWRDDFTHVYKLFVLGVEKEEIRGQFAGGRRLREVLFGDIRLGNQVK
jgi:hypothetical protein